jgi:hypothetical protein
MINETNRNFYEPKTFSFPDLCRLSAWKERGRGRNVRFSVPLTSQTAEALKAAFAFC